MNYSIAGESTLAEDEVRDHDENRRTTRSSSAPGQDGPPLAKRLSEVVSKLNPTILEYLGSSAA
jgi:hypothetical protein